jgi:alanine-glyoxylate transaminase / serine-glyoxylate transaminase / serine-pyruvate transaminase
MSRRKTKCASWYLDVSMLRNYWGEDRAYHHTAPITMLYALRESLRLVLEEGLEARFERHRRHHDLRKRVSRPWASNSSSRPSTDCRN